MDCPWYRYDTFKKNWHHLPKEYIYFDFDTLNFNIMKILINKKEKKKGIAGTRYIKCLFQLLQSKIEIKKGW